MKYKLSAKIPTAQKPDGQWWSFGNLSPGEKTPWRAGIKTTKEFRDYVNSLPMDAWINLSAFEDKPKDAGSQAPQTSAPMPDDDEIPFN